MRILAGHSDFVEAVAFSPRGDLLASGGADGHVWLWELPSGRQRESTPMGRRDTQIGALAFSSDGRKLCLGSHDGGVEVRDVDANRRLRAWSDQGRLSCAAFSPADDRLAWCSYHAVTVCGPGGAGRATRPLAGQTPPLYCLAFSPDGATLAVGGLAPYLSLWHTRRRTLSRLTHGCEQGCWRLAYSPDGRLLALALARGLQLWDSRAEQQLAEYRDHTEVVSGLAFSPDGRRLLTCSWDGTVRLDEVAGRPGQLRHIDTYDWGLGKLYDVAVSPDGTLAAAGGDEAGYLVVWDLE
jgi:WD40 repeat protein